MSNPCPECEKHAVTFIKGLSLCEAHVRQLMKLARASDGKYLAASPSAMLAAIETHPVGAQTRSV